MSDGTTKAVVLEENNERVYNCAEDSIPLVFGADCSDTIGAGECSAEDSEAILSEYDPIVGNISYYSCSKPATELICRVAISIAGVTFVSTEINVAPGGKDSISFADFDIVE